MHRFCLIAEIDRKLQITSQFAQCFQDYRQSNRIDHSIESLIKQRIYGLVMGYEDLNDHDELRHDPMFTLAESVAMRSPTAGAPAPSRKVSKSSAIVGSSAACSSSEFACSSQYCSQITRVQRL
ncbi:MAG: transposase [Nostoc sp.]